MTSVRELEEAAGDYCTALRMRDGVGVGAERRLYDALIQVREELGDSAVVDRKLAALLAEIVVASNATIDRYEGEQRLEVTESVATISEAVMAVLSQSEMPPLPRRA